MPTTLKPDLDLPEKTNVAVLEAKKQYKAEDGDDYLSEEYSKFAGVNEYSVSGWLQFNKNYKQENWHSIFRLTINEPSI